MLLKSLLAVKLGIGLKNKRLSYFWALGITTGLLLLSTLVVSDEQKSLAKHKPSILSESLLLQSYEKSYEESHEKGHDDWHEFGRKLYNYRCYYCHGYSGNAKTLAATFMEPAPRDFTSMPLSVSKQYMLDVLENGKPGTGMVSFVRYLDDREREAVIDFIRQEFMLNKNINTLYHTIENGWPNHERYTLAFPFATGEIPLDTPQQQLNDKQLKGYQLFMTTCISCHDRAIVNNEGNIWQARSVSYPRNNFSYTKIDAISSASVFAKHDIKNPIKNLNPVEQKGESLFQKNCAFCHAADATGKNWIGSFLDKAPRDLTQDFINNLSQEQLVTMIQRGVPGSSMPAWKNVMSEEQIISIVAYLKRVVNYVKSDQSK